MSNWKFSKKAEEDLQDIYDFTVYKWGLAQAKKYNLAIETATLKIADNPNLGRSISHIVKDCQQWRVGHHLLIYRTSPGQVLILRILHEKMDTARHL